MPTKIGLVKAMVFPVVMYGCKSWTIKKTEIMTSGPITSWEIDGETVETVSDFIFWAPKSLQMVIAAMKLRRLLLGSEVMTNLDDILEKAMATHSSTLAWRISWTEELGGLPSMGVTKSQTRLSE